MCENIPSTKDILIIDRGDNWRSFAVDALCQEGYNTTGSKTYTVPSDNIYDLILLGCDEIGEEESLFIRDTRIHQHVIVVASMEGHRFSVIRRGFLSGAYDVMLKPMGHKSLLEDVRDALSLVKRKSLLHP